MLKPRCDTLLPERLDLDLTINIGDTPVTMGKLSYIREDVLEVMVQQRVKEAIEAGERQNFNCRCVVKQAPKPERDAVLELTALDNFSCLVIEEKQGIKPDHARCIGHDEVFDNHGKEIYTQYEFQEFGVETSFYRPDATYGITWRCWDHMPTAEERAAHPWKEET